MTTAWAHLPNARHIAGIIADVQARPKAWGDALVAAHVSVPDATWSAAWSAAAGIPRSSPQSAACATTWSAAAGVTWSAARYAVRDTLAVLLAWPDSARMLTMTPAALRTLIDITDGDVRHQAVLLLPAVLARYVPTEGD